MEYRGASLLLAVLFTAFLSINLTEARYSEKEDARVIAAFRQRFMRPRNHAKVARQLVHNVNWSAIGTISSDKKLPEFPMVNLVSISDSIEDGNSTGRIYFLLTDLDFTGKDFRKHNKVTMFFTSEQGGNCSRIDVDPMEPVCPRAIISGEIQVLNKGDKGFEFGWNAFISRHPAAHSWIERHNFYLCLLNIEHIYVLDYYGGAKDVSVSDYYKVTLENDDSTNLNDNSLEDDS